MTSYWDLEACTYFDSNSDFEDCTWTWSDSLKAVGWLGSNADFPTGELAPEVVDALRALTVSAWQPISYLGSHYCALCIRAAGGFIQDIVAAGMQNDGSRRGSRNVFIPGKGFVYVAPALILHYISEHQYVPPPAFCAAVLECPRMNSAAYFAALRRNATGDFAKIVPS